MQTHLVRPSRRADLSPLAAAAMAAVLAIGGGAIRPAAAQNAPPEDVVETMGNILRDMHGRRNLDDIWPDVARLRRLRDSIAPLLLQRAETAPEHVRLGLGRAAANLGEDIKGGQILVELATTGSSPSIRRQAVTALMFVPTLFGHKPVTGPLDAALAEETDPMHRIVLARTLWRLTASDRYVRALRALTRHDKPRIANEAALVLAENGQIALVRNQLMGILGDPTAQGERAFTVLRMYKLKESVENKKFTRDDKGTERAMRLLREVIQKIKDQYVDPDKVDLDKMSTAAVVGVVKTLDQFSGYLDEEDVALMNQNISGKYGGIGAYVGIRNDVFTIISPIYGGPAYRAGLKSLDQIHEVDGVKTRNLKFENVISRLKGTPGTPVKIKVYRRGWGKMQEFLIVREEIKVKSVHTRLLPGDVGYVRLVRFGERTARDLDRILTRLEGQGMKSLILDLRNNPGGLLAAARDVADLFIEGGKTIVSSKGRPGSGRVQVLKSRAHTTHPRMPMTILVNSGSASASEIVAGALQDYKRAALIGEKTFGKGSVQQIIPLRSTYWATRLRLTVAKYYLPFGRSIHEVGIEPDIKIRNEEIPGWEIELLLKYHGKRRFQDYVTGLWEQSLSGALDVLAGDDKDLRADLLDLNGFRLKPYLDVKTDDPNDGASVRARKKRLNDLATRLRTDADLRARLRAFAAGAGLDGIGDNDEPFDVLPRLRSRLLRRYYELSETDRKDPSNYPGFDDFYKNLKADVPHTFRVAIARQVRQMIRQRVADDRGALFAVDVQEDRQIQRAIYELFRKMDRRLADHDMYKSFADTFKPEAKTAAHAKVGEPAETAK